MRKRITLFDVLFDAACKAGQEIRAGQITHEKKSVKECAEACKKIASYVYDVENRDEEKEREARNNTENGIWVVSSSFRSVIRQMQLLQIFEKKDYSVELDLLETLVAHLGNAVYYEPSAIDSLLEKAALLYITAKENDGRGLHKHQIMEEEELLVKAIRVLKKEQVKIVFVQGEPEIESDSEQEFVQNMDSLIKQIGGMYMISRLFKREIEPKYNEQLGRYMICRNKYTSLYKKELRMRIPYQYLLQLSLKHLSDNVLVSEQYKQAVYEKIIYLSSAYMEVLQLQGYYSMEELFYQLEDFPLLLSRNLCFEKIYIPRQYHPEYLQMLLKGMLEPFYQRGASKPRPYSFYNYYQVASYVLEHAKGPTIFDKSVLKDTTRISDYKLNLILQDISMDVSEVNKNFLHYLDETNAWRKPLIKLDDEQYFCLDARMSGYAFYEAMYQILFVAQGTLLSREQGKYLEKMVYKMFQEKRFPYLKGKYYAKGNLPERDCDMILEDQEHVMFMEIKKCPLPSSYEQADDVKVLQSLESGMLYAQEQILWHKLRLKELGVLELYDDEGNHVTDYSLAEKKRILSVSICMPDYDFLTNKVCTEPFLESTLLVTYHARDASREKLLNKLNARSQNIMKVAERLFDGRRFDVREVFFNSQFRSLQQIWVMLKLSKNVEEFIDCCHTQNIMITGAGDVYAEILHVFKMKK